MTAAQIYRLFFDGGNYAKQYLIKLSHPVAGTLRFVNNNQNVVFNNETYSPANFDYTRPDSLGGGGSLNISAIDNADLFEWIDKADYRYMLTVVGIINGSEVQEIKSYKHFYGSISMGDNNELNFTLENDGRLDMQFTVYKYDTDLNKGNAC